MIDPHLGPLADNGGPTPTMLPAADSPAVDAGDNNGAPSVDQRGTLRPLGGTVDIGAVEAVFLTVTRFDDGNLPGQLRRAIRDANDLGGSHVIYLPAGTYHLTVPGANEDGNLTGDLNILHNITLVGAGAGQTIIDASALGDRAFHVEPGATLSISGVTIEGGSTTGDGGAILNDHGTLLISHSELKDNSAAQGGAVANETSSNASGAFPVSKLASSTNGIDAATGTIAVADASQFPTTLPFTIAIDKEEMTVTDVAGDTLFVTRGANGTTAASHAFGAQVSVVGGTATTTLAAIQSRIAVTDVSVFPSNPGFFIQVGSEEMQVVAISPQDNTFTVIRGVNGTTVATHAAGERVGLVTLSIDSSTLDGNTATSGGGAYNLGGMSIINSTLSGNSASQGGGILNDGDSSTTFGGLVTLTNDTISGNQATGSGGGVGSIATFPELALHNTIVAGNAASSGNADLNGAFTSLGHNLIGDIGSASGLTDGVNGDQAGGNGNPTIDPLLSPLRNNGGPLPTMALLPGSPAIDAGDDAGAPATDERSIARNQGPHVDIGAYEVAYDLVVDLPGGGTQSLFTPLGQGLTQMSSPNGAFQPFTFENPSHSLTIVSHSGGNDVISVGQLESGFTVGVNGDGQGDKIQLLSGSVLNPAGGETILGNDTLAGVGTVATPLTLNADANLAPDAADPLTVTSNLTLGPGSNFVETLAGPVAGSGYDQVVVTGTGVITLGGATLDATKLASFIPAAGSQFTIINNQTGNPIVGTFAGLPEDQLFAIGNGAFWITYHGGASGNDVVLNVAEPPTVAAQSGSSVEGATFAGTLATFADTVPNANPADYSASIVWGDGATTPGTISGSQAAGFTVTGSHVYKEEGNYATTVLISDLAGTASAAGTIQVADAPLTAEAAAIASTEGATFSGAVATFTDADPNGSASDYTASILWGDGQTSPGTISGSENTGFTVTASHAYAEEGAYTATVTISDHGSNATAVDNVQVADAPLAAAAGPTLNATEGAPFTAAVASFADANPNATAADFTVAIDWGDHNTSTGTVTGDAAGGFAVIGTHAYAEEGSYTINVTINDAGGSQATASATVQTADASLTASGTSINAVDGIVSAQAVVATFVDLGGSESVADYSAAIDWGDGNASPGTIVANSDGSFSVEGGHAYASLGSYTVTVSITHENGISATAQSTALVQFNTGLLVLDPTHAGALNDLGNGTIQVSGGEIQVDSSSRAAIIAAGRGTLSASKFLVSGSPGVFTLGRATLTGPVTSGATALSDPLTGLIAPSPDPAPHAAVFAHGVQQLTLDPGTYAGGIHVDGRAVVTLNPGTYYLEGGGLSVSGRASLIGEGVTIYNAGSNGTRSNGKHVEECDSIIVSGRGSLQLSAPESGSLESIAVFQDRTAPSPMIVSGAASVQVSGLIYAADATLIVTGDAQLAVRGDVANGLEAACIFDDVSVSGRALLSINAAQNAQTSGGDSSSAANTASGSSTGDAAHDDLRALESFFQSLIDSSHGDEPSLWAIGLGDGGEHDGFGRRH